MWIKRTPLSEIMMMTVQCDSQSFSSRNSSCGPGRALDLNQVDDDDVDNNDDVDEDGVDEADDDDIAIPDHPHREIALVALGERLI